MGGIGNDDLGSLGFATVAEVLLNAPNGREFSLRSCHGLERDLVHSGADFKHVLHLVENRKQTLQVVFGLVRMNVGNAGSWAMTSLTRGLCFMVQDPNG